jgi:hypothetical protein
MKSVSLLTLGILLIAGSAQANDACSSLSQYAGVYHLVSKDCDGGVFGEILTIEPNSQNAQQYMIVSGGIGIGPSSQANSADTCNAKDESLQVSTCTSDQSCLPQAWSYTISKSSVNFSARGCMAKYQK